MKRKSEEDLGEGPMGLMQRILNGSQRSAGAVVIFGGY